MFSRFYLMKIHMLRDLQKLFDLYMMFLKCEDTTEGGRNIMRQQDSNVHSITVIFYIWTLLLQPDMLLNCAQQSLWKLRKQVFLRNLL